MTNRIVQDLNDPAAKIISTQISARIASSNIQAQISHKENIDKIIESACKGYQKPQEKNLRPGQKQSLNQDETQDLASCIKEDVKIDTVKDKKGREIFNSKKMGISSTTGTICKKSQPGCDLDLDIKIKESKNEKKKYVLSVSIKGAGDKKANVNFERLTREFEF